MKEAVGGQRVLLSAGHTYWELETRSGPCWRRKQADQDMEFTVRQSTPNRGAQGVYWEHCEVICFAYAEQIEPAPSDLERLASVATQVQS